MELMSNNRETDPLDKLPPILRQNREQNLCTCNEVAKMDVIDAIANGATTLEAVRKQTYASDGNGCCTRQVERLIECLTGDCTNLIDPEGGTPSD